MQAPDERRPPAAASPTPDLSRRRFVQSLGLAGFSAAVLTACGSGSKAGTSGGSSTKASGTVTFGLNANAAVPTAGYDSVFQAFTQKTKIKVKTNKSLYTDQINNYLTAAPVDVLIWNAGYRMRFFASKGLISDVNSTWHTIGSNIDASIKRSCTASDGKQYLVPFYNYPWVVYYRKSLFNERGYTVPKTFSDFTALCNKMRGDSITPMAFADKEGWEAMGTFDILNMRMNGYDFHLRLLDGKESWEDQNVKDVFKQWAELLPYHQSGPLGRTWQEAAQSVDQKKSGMYFVGSFAADQFTAAGDDLDVFPFPEINSQHGQDAMDAPIDGFMMVAKPDNRPAADALLRYLASGPAETLYLKTDKNSVGVAKDVDASGYTRLQKRYAELIGNTKNIAQYLDRDTRPDFAAPVVLPAIQAFLNRPSNVDQVTQSIQKQAKNIFAN